jgi:hypothetical protein
MTELEFDIRGLMKLVCLAFYEAQARARKRMQLVRYQCDVFLACFFLRSSRSVWAVASLLLTFCFLLLLSPAPKHKLRFFFSNL